MTGMEPARKSPRRKAAVQEKPADDAQQFAIAAARIAHDHHVDDISVLDLRGLSSLTDYFVIGTGSSDRQMHAVLDRIEEHARTVGRSPFKVADSRSASWILADYVDVIVHLFDEQHRDYYDLAGLWGDSPSIEWREPPQIADERRRRRAD